MDADLITISTDGATYLEGWLDISPTFADLAYGTDNSEVLLTNFNAKIKVNNVTLIEGTTTATNMGGGLPINLATESKITFDSSGTNKTFVDNGTAEITIDGGLLAIKADSGYAGGWVEVDSSIASLSFGTSKGDVAVTNVDASLKFGATNGVQANATGLGLLHQ